MTLLIPRDQRIGRGYLAREGSTGVVVWATARDAKVVSKGPARVPVAGHPGQMVFVADTGNGDRFVSLPGQGLTPTSLTVTFSGFAVQHTLINRTFPGPPGAGPNSILISGTEPVSLSWTFTGLAGGSVTHGTQTNSIFFYNGYSGLGGGSSVVCVWRCILTLVSSGVYSISVGGLPTIGGSSWGRTTSCGIGQTTVNSNPTPQLSTLPFGESFANGGTFTITPVY